MDTMGSDLLQFSKFGSTIVHLLSQENSPVGVAYLALYYADDFWRVSCHMDGRADPYSMLFNSHSDSKFCTLTLMTDCAPQTDTTGQVSAAVAMVRNRLGGGSSSSSTSEPAAAAETLTCCICLEEVSEGSKVLTRFI